MTQRSTGARGLRASAILVSLGAVLSGPVAMLLVSQTAPQPPWTDVQTFADSYRPIQVLPYVLGYVLLLGFVMFAASCHAGSKPALRVRTSGSLIFTAIYAALVFTNYTIQLGFIPRVLRSRPPLLVSLLAWNVLIPICFGLIAVAPERDFVGAPAGTDP